MNSFEVGDLVIHKLAHPETIQNLIGIIIRINITTEFQKSTPIDNHWYVVQFGSFVLVVSEEMIEKI
jgi:hypothetical protein